MGGTENQMQGVEETAARLRLIDAEITVADARVRAIVGEASPEIVDMVAAGHAAMVAHQRQLFTRSIEALFR